MPDDLAAELSRAIAGEAIVPHFQPMVDLRTGGLSGFAVLAHWHHPTRGTIHPAAFIPLAEQTGLTQRQSEVMRLLAIGRSVKEIARQLNLGLGTVRTYLSQAYRALGGRNRTEALIRSGLMLNR